MTDTYEMSSERYRKNADDCRQRATQAIKPTDRAAWLKISEEWQRLAEEMDAAEAKRHGP